METAATRRPELLCLFAIVWVLMLAACSQTDPGASTPASTRDWVAHSAYGLQLSVPRSWSVQVFGQCPDGRKPGTLFIGASEFLDNCPMIPSNANLIAMSKATAPIPTSAAKPPQQTRVHGLSALSRSNGTGVDWIIPSKQVTITGSGPGALSVARTLTPTTRYAIPAIGQVSGVAYSGSLQQLPVSGPVTVVMPAVRKSTTLSAIGGHFTYSGRPGTYVLTGHDGNVLCPPVSVRLVSGERIDAPPIRCQGD